MKLFDKLQLWKMFPAKTWAEKRRIIQFMRSHCRMSDQFSEEHVDMVLPVLDRVLYQAFQDLEVDRLRHYLFYLTGKLSSSQNKNELALDILVNLKHCKNSFTPFMEPVEDIPMDAFHVTSYKRCHHVDELMDYLISTPKNLDPSDARPMDQRDPIWKYHSEKRFLLTHPGIPREKTTQLQKIEKTMPLTDLPPEIYSRYIELIGKLGYIMRNDSPSSYASSGFDVSEDALQYFTSELEKLDPELQKRILDLQYERKGDETVGSLLDSLGKKNTCLHGVGNRLIRVYLLHHRILQGLSEDRGKKKKRQQQQYSRPLLPLFIRVSVDRNSPEKIEYYVFGNENVNYTNFRRDTILFSVIYEYDPLQASYILKEIKNKNIVSMYYIEAIRSVLNEFSVKNEDEAGGDDGGGGVNRKTKKTRFEN